MERKTNTPEDGLLTSKVVHLALPVRWSLVGQEGRGAAEMACTYDIHPHGARLLSAREVNIGDLVMVERGRNKAICQVVWAGDPSSPLRGQFSVQCVEGRTPWDEELRRRSKSSTSPSYSMARRVSRRGALIFRLIGRRPTGGAVRGFTSRARRR